MINMSAAAAAAAARAARIAAARAQLVIERRRRTRLEEDIETLRQSADRMEDIRQSVDSNNSTFREASRRDQTNWRGQLGNRYNTNRTQAKTNTRTYLGEMSTLIQRVNQQRTTLSNQLITVNNTIRNLERIANGGF